MAAMQATMAEMGYASDESEQPDMSAAPNGTGSPKEMALRAGAAALQLNVDGLNPMAAMQATMAEMGYESDKGEEEGQEEEMWGATKLCSGTGAVNKTSSADPILTTQRSIGEARKTKPARTRPPKKPDKAPASNGKGSPKEGVFHIHRSKSSSVGPRMGQQAHACVLCASAYVHALMSLIC